MPFASADICAIAHYCADAATLFRLADSCRRAAFPLVRRGLVTFGVFRLSDKSTFSGPAVCGKVPPGDVEHGVQRTDQQRSFTSGPGPLFGHRRHPGIHRYGTQRGSSSGAGIHDRDDPLEIVDRRELNRDPAPATTKIDLDARLESLRQSLGEIA